MVSDTDIAQLADEVEATSMRGLYQDPKCRTLSVREFSLLIGELLRRIEKDGRLS
jgi:hypothetical protein